MEIWKPVKDYEGLYEVSNLGNVKSLPKKWKGGKGCFRKHDGIVLTPFFTGGKRKYKCVELSKESVKKTIRVHQLVAICFLNHIIDSNTKLVVDHINNDPLDNRVDNLQLITQRENSSKDVKNKTSKYTGVCWNKQKNKWMAYIKINGKLKNLGLFKCELEASVAYQNKLNTL